MIARKLFAMLIAAIRKELTIQKPEHNREPVAMCNCKCNCRQETRQEKIRKTGFNGFAMIVVITIVMAILIL